MSVIIRLQNLPWSANAIDIRRFFQGLSIPDGGVHIVGGSEGDAFMAFSTDDDARKAMQLDGRRLGDAAVKLLLSSKNEMQSVITSARKPPAGGPPPDQPFTAPQGFPSGGGPPTPARPSGDAPFSNEQRFTPGSQGQGRRPGPDQMSGPGMPGQRPPNQWGVPPQEGFGMGGPGPNDMPMQRQPLMRGPNFQGGPPDMNKDNVTPGGFPGQNAFGMEGARNDQNRRPLNESPANRRLDGPPRPGFGRGGTPANNSFGRGRDMRGDGGMLDGPQPLLGRGPAHRGRGGMQPGKNSFGARQDNAFRQEQPMEIEKGGRSSFGAPNEGFGRGRGRPLDGSQGQPFPGPGGNDNRRDSGNQGQRNNGGFGGDANRDRKAILPMHEGDRPPFGRPMQIPEGPFGRGSPAQDNRPGFGRGAPRAEERPGNIRDNRGSRLDREDPIMGRDGTQSGFDRAGPPRDIDDSARDRPRQPFGRGAPRGGAGFGGRGGGRPGEMENRERPLLDSAERPGFGRGGAMQQGGGRFGQEPVNENGGFGKPQLSGEGMSFGSQMGVTEEQGHRFGLSGHDSFRGHRAGLGLVRGTERGPGRGRGDVREVQRGDDERGGPLFGRGAAMREPEGRGFGRGFPPEDNVSMFGRDTPSLPTPDQRNRDAFGASVPDRDMGPRHDRSEEKPGLMGMRPWANEREGGGLGLNRDIPMGRPDFMRNSLLDGQPGLLGAAPGNISGALMSTPGPDVFGDEREPMRRDFGDRSRRGDRPQGDRPQGDRPQGDRPQGDRPQGDRPQGDRPQGDRPQGDRDHRRDNRDNHDRKRPRDVSQCVFIGGLSRSVSFRDVRKFFSRCEIPSDGLKLINDRNGNRTGDCYVRFGSVGTAEEAMRRDGSYIADRRVKMESCSQQDFERAIDSANPAKSSASGGVGYNQDSPNLAKRPRSRSPASRRHSDYDTADLYISVKNMSIKTEKQDLKKFFSSIRLVSGSMFFEYNVDLDRAIGFLEVANKRDFKEAQKFDKHTLKGQTISVYPISKREYDEQTGKIKKYSQSKSAKSSSSAPGSRDSSSTPSRTASSTPSSKDASSAPSSKDASSAPSSKDASSAPSSKNTSTAPSKEPIVTISSTTSVRSSTEVKTPAAAKPTAAMPKSASSTLKTASSTPKTTTQGDKYVVLVEGLPDSAKGSSVQTFFNGLQVAKRGMNVIYRSDGKAAGSAYVVFETLTDHEAALKRTQNYMSKNRIKVTAVNVPNVMDVVRQEMAKAAAVEVKSSDEPEPGCKVKMTNCAFRADESVIEEFFHYCYPIAGSVSIQRSPGGRPSGEAYIAFNTPQDARRAINERNKQFMMGRPVNLYIA